MDLKNIKLPIQVSTIVESLMVEGREIDFFSKISLERIKTNFKDLDKLTGGLHKGDLIVVGARPGMGKSSFILSLMERISRDNIPVLLFSIESKKLDILVSLLSNISKLPHKTIIYGELKDELKTLREKAIRELYNRPLYIDDCPFLDIIDLCNKIRASIEKYCISVVFIDYLQMLFVKDRIFDTRYEELNHITRQLKMLAKELNIPIIVTSQLNRNLEERTVKRPTLTDFRDSGTICDDVDMACLLYRPEYYKITEDERGNSLLGVAEFIIAKQRFGDTGTIKLKFDAQSCRFDDFEEDKFVLYSKIEKYADPPF